MERAPSRGTGTYGAVQIGWAPRAPSLSVGAFVGSAQRGFDHRDPLDAVAAQRKSLGYSPNKNIFTTNKTKKKTMLHVVCRFASNEHYQEIYYIFH